MNFKDPSSIAYLLGALYGDGCFYHKEGGRILFSSADREFTEILATIIRDQFYLSVTINTNRLSLKNKNWRDAYTFSSRPLYKLLKDLSKMAVPDFVRHGEKSTKGAFISGFFDAEGSVDIHSVRDGTETQRHLKCFNNNSDFLKELQNMLKEFDINSCIIKSKGKNWCLNIWNYHSLSNFERYINFKIARKSSKLRQAIASYMRIQIQWNKDTHEKVMYLRSKGLGATSIRKELGEDVPRPTIESWIYRKTK